MITPSYPRRITLAVRLCLSLPLHQTLTETGKFKSLVNIPSLLLALRMVALKGKNIIAHVSTKSNNKHPSEERLVDVTNIKRVHAVEKAWTSGGQEIMDKQHKTQYIVIVKPILSTYCVLLKAVR